MSKKLTVKQIKEKIGQLKSERSTWESHWQECADYLQPKKASITVTPQAGQKRSVNVLDSTGIQSNELLAGALHGLLTNPNAEWFEMTTGDLDLDRQDDVRFFLQKATKTIHNVLNNSNFQTEIHEAYLDLCCFGTVALLIEEDADMVVRFSSKFIGEFYIEESSRGVVDRLYREWKWKADKIVEEYGINKVPAIVKKAFLDGKTEEFCLVHAVYPRIIVDPTSKSAFTYISQTVMPDQDFEIREEGFREFPYVVPRWTKATGETYGRSPGMNALPEVKTLNKMTETMIMGAQKVVDPPLQLPDDGFIMPIVTTPGGLNYYRSGTNDKITPVFNDSRIDFGYEAMKDRRTRIREAYYIDQLQLQQGPQMTATEVLQRTEEKMRLLGPMLGRQQSELLRPMIDRSFAISLRRGIIPQSAIPQILRGRKIDVKYSSLIAKSQRLADGQNLMRAMEALTPFVNMDQKVVDNIDGDKAFRVVAEVYGVPQEVVRKAKDRDGIRQARADAQQAALQQQQEGEAQAAAPNMVDAMQKMQQMGSGG